MEISGSGTQKNHGLHLVEKFMACEGCDRLIREGHLGCCPQHFRYCDKCLCPCQLGTLQIISNEVELMQFPGVFDLLIFQTATLDGPKICMTAPRYQSVEVGGGAMRMEMSCETAEKMSERVQSVSELMADSKAALLKAITEAGNGQPVSIRVALSQDGLRMIGLESLAEAPWGELMKPSERLIQ